MCHLVQKPWRTIHVPSGQSTQGPLSTQIWMGSIRLVSSRRVPLHVSDPLDYNRFDLHVCSNVPPSHIHIQIRSNDTSIVPLSEWQFPIFLGFITNSALISLIIYFLSHRCRLCACDIDQWHWASGVNTCDLAAMSPASLSGVALMGRALVLHVSPFSPVARSPALLVFTCSLVHRENDLCIPPSWLVKNWGFEQNLKKPRKSSVNLWTPSSVSEPDQGIHMMPPKWHPSPV